MSNRTNEIVRQFSPEYPQIFSLANEDFIDLSLFPIDTTDAEHRIDDCSACLKIGTATFDGRIKLSRIGDPLPSLEHFMRLFDAANSIPGRATDYITALNFKYGINDMMKPVIYYQPLVLNRDKLIGPSEYEYVTVPCPALYKYDPVQGFLFADPAIYNGDFSRYRQQIKLLHQGAFRSFMSGVDSESAVFSFQEIIHLICDNWNASERVYVYNAVIHITGDPQVDVRHSLVLAYDEIGFKGFEGKCADLAHLCPPNCKISYTLR